MSAGRAPSRMTRVLTRRRATIVVPALCATMLGALVSLALPRVYVAETQIEIAGANGLGGADYQSRVAAVADQILCRDAFDKVATKLRLDVDFASLPEGERKEKREALLARLKDDAGCSVKAAGEAQTVATITSSGADADLATRVVGALAEQAMSLAGNPTIAVKEKTEAEREAVTKTAKQALDAADLARQDFRAQNREFLEGAAHKLQATRDQKKQLKESTIAGLEQKRKDLDEMLLQERPFETVTVRQADPLKLAAIEEKIATSKEHVRQLTTVDKRADTDPDVAAERKAIAEAEDEKKKLIAEAPQTEQRRENEQWAQLTRAKGETQSRLDAANRQLKLLVETEKEQEELARRTPEFEANAAKLDAAYETAKEAHDKVAAELAKAQTDLSAERARGELAIHTILAAEKPHSPAGPGALVLAGMGLALGAIAGFVAACVLDATDHSFRDEASVTQFLGVPTLGAVRVIETPAEAAQRRARRRKSSAVLAVLGVAALAVVAVALFGDAHGVADFVKSVVG